MLLQALIWAACGWLVGMLAARLSVAVAGPSARSSVPRWLTWLGPLASDPALQAGSALSFGLLAWRLESGLPLAVFSAYAVVLIALLVVDARTRYVYDAMAYPPLAGAILLTPLAVGGPFWEGALGAGVGGVLFWVIYAAGKRFYGGVTPMGAGDITLAALLGAMVGAQYVLTGLFLSTLLGAAIGLGYAVRFRSLRVSMPYGPSICLAGLVLLVVRAWS